MVRSLLPTSALSLALLGCGDDSASRPSAEEVASDGTRVVEPAVRRSTSWVDPRAPERATVTSVEHWMAGVHEQSQRQPERPDVSLETRARIDAARMRALSVLDVSGAWLWSDVRDVIADMGVGVRIRAGTPREQSDVVEGSELAFDILHDEVVVFEDQIGGRDTAYLASVLAHEATHAVYLREVLRGAHVTPLELNWWLAHCTDTDRAFRFTSEAVAYLNEAAFVATVDGEDRVAENAAADYLVPALAAAQGDAAGREVYARALRAMVEAVPVSASADRRPCGPIVVLRGSDRGQHYYPTDAAPELLVPIWDAAWSRPD